MRLVRCLRSDGPHVGVVEPGTRTAAISRDWTDIADSFGAEQLRTAAGAAVADPLDVVEFDGLQLLPPVSPSSVRDFMTFEQHLLPIVRRQGGDALPAIWYELPIGYFSNAATVHGPHEPVEIPGGCHELDFELEIGAVVGRTARSVRAEDAGDYLAGFVLFCDWSARDLQLHEMSGRLGPFKGKDFASSLGAFFVTPDELADVRDGAGYRLAMTSAVNDMPYGQGSWDEAAWSFEELISFASWNSTVEAGALLGSGTSRGGCIAELAARHTPEQYPWLAAGDRVHLEVERLGALDATVTAPVREPWPHRRPPRNAGL
jgi:2-keto-4-pentenoate hydratase/2-oxohepta-3-ene-1,7-dioic acid hydratase (catechol pathway)